MSSHEQSVMRQTPTRWDRITVAFLAISYGVGAPLVALLELQRHMLSERFHYAAAFIYLVCAVQFVCAVALLVRRLAPWAAAVLTVTTIGAAVSHIRIGAPRAALPALGYTVVQVWFGLRSHKPKAPA